MPTVASLLPVSHLPVVSLPPRRPSSILAQVQLPRTRHHREIRPLIFASSASSFDELNAGPKSRFNNNSKKSTLLNLIQDIEPFDVSIIQKDVPPTTVDAMKRTISGMLGLLPSNRFQVLIEALWEPLSKLLVSSMMTGYTLRNAEYQLCLAKNLDIFKENFEQQKTESAKLDAQKMLLDSTGILDFTEKNEMLQKSKKFEEDTSCNIGIQDLGAITPEAQQYIVHLQSRLSSVRKELHEIKRKNAALQMQQFVGEEKNDLLDYLRSLQPEKVAELSEPTSPQLKETIHCVVHGLLATLSPKMHSKSPLPLSENTTGGTLNFRNEEDCAELVEDTPLQFQPIISVTRDYLARLLFWCMLLGHYLRGLEYRLQLMELLTLSSNAESSDTCGGEQVI